jgi:hypothetical protein
MSSANLVLHVHEHPDADAAQRLSGALKEVPGVTEARHNPDHDNLFVVEYEAGAVAPEALLDAARAAGFSGELVGM